MNEIVKVVIAAILVVFLILLIVDILNPQYGFFAKVNAGHVGIVDNMGKVEDEALQPGFHLTRFFSKVVPIDARVQKIDCELEAFSKDIQQTVLTMSVNYSIKAEKAGYLYKNVGMDYAKKLIVPRMQENTKVVVGDYTAETLIANREDISKKILTKMREDMSQYGIDITVISIENIDFTDAFESAVEAKQVATQEKQRARTQQEQQTMEAEQAASRAKIKADSAAEVQRIQADAEAYSVRVKAEAEAEANSQIAKSLTPDLIDYEKANRWDGKLPTTFMGDGSALPVFQVTDPFGNNLDDEFDEGN